MLTANVLCIKKRKKRSYCISNISDRVPPPARDKRSVETTVTMMHITEDTPPDMLAGAMDLTVHLPTGRSVKMSIERSTPMMDLLVQITTAHHLQLSGYIIQALGMAPSSEHSDKILPYKPSTPIGALDTQHIKVIPKGRTLPITKNVLPGRQPFESTFRLKVHLPRNQLYVCRVSRNVHLEDIMKKVCDEKNLDPLKYEFRHPGNLDEVLDPKLTLNDYQITEIHIVSKGTVTLMQAFSSSDIMALRKEEERKQMQAKTGGGVFNLIFKRGKNSMGSGSLSSENRSISPTHSDDSRSLTPPAIQQPILPPVQKNPPVEKPKPPQRKRRPAPKPPQNVTDICKTPEKPPSEISSDSNTLKVQQKKADNELTICHSRNSSDSSGYHEASVLSDNCNTTLPRRPKSIVVNESDCSRMSGKHSKSTGNLSKFKSTSSLALTGRKKKAAPPPPPVLKAASSVTDISKPSPVVASLPLEEQTLKEQDIEIHTMSKKVECEPSPKMPVQNEVIEAKVVEPTLSEIQEENEQKSVLPKPLPRSRIAKHVDVDIPKPKPRIRAPLPPLSPTPCPVECIFSSTQARDDDEESKISSSLVEEQDVESKSKVIHVSDQSSTFTDFEREETQTNKNDTEIIGANSKATNEIFSEAVDTKPPEIVGFISKKSNISNKSFDTCTRPRGFQIGSSLLYVDQNVDDTYSLYSIDNESLQGKSSSETISLNSFNNHSDFTEIDDMSSVDIELFSGSVAKRAKKKKTVLNELLGIHDLDVDKKKSIKKNSSLTSLHSTDSFINGNNMKKWNNCQDLDDISVISDSISLRGKWSVGDSTNTECLSTAFTVQTPRESNGSIRPPSHSPSPPPSSRKSSYCGDITYTTETVLTEPLMEKNNLQKLSSVNDSGIDISMELKVEADLDIDWQYPLPSPPKAFRDSSPPSTTGTLNYNTTRTIEDSVVTSPELFEKLKPAEDSPSEVASDITSIISEEDKQMCNKLTLEHLEKRKSLVYNRELATSLKYSEDKEENITAMHNNVLNELENVINQNQKVSTLSRQNSHVKDTVIHSSDRNLPNFKITTYDNPKKKINIFEDDSVRSNEPITTTESKQSSDLDNEFKSLNPQSFNKICEGNSMDNISFRKHSFDSQSENDVFKRPQDYLKHKINTNKNNYLLGKEDSSNNVTRSESFSVDKNVGLWKPIHPVKRSKSQVAINRCQEDTRTKQNDEDNLSKSNSLYDLQSLGVIRMIQTKLNTPSNSTEELDHAPEQETTKKMEASQDVKPISSIPVVIVNRGPPAINLSTWSERPKKQVSLKEDNDYKINNNKDNTNSNNIPSNNYTKINTSYEYSDQITTNNVTIKVNGSETISTEKTGNLVIKIGGTQNENITFRKPLGNINKIESKSRPHSIAFDSNFDISRVPIVRSVELKKPFKNIPSINNRSSTQINSTNTNGLENNYHHNGKDGPVSFNTFVDNKFASNRFSETYRSSENLNSKTDGNRSNVYINSDPANKPVIRVNSFVQNTPVVRGFRDNTNRKSWTPVNTYGTLPLKPVNQNQTSGDDSSVVNKNVPFAQPVLRKVESSRCFNSNNGSNNPIFGNVVLRNIPQKYNNEHRNSMGLITSNKINSEAVQPPPPPPPVLPKNCNFTKKPFETEVTPRDKMLSEIRNFGGKKGLKSIKA